MNEFIKKWKTEPKYKAKVQLALYSGFFLIAIIFAFVSSNTSSPKSNNSINLDNKTTSTITVPNEYKYLILIDLNGEEYSYKGKVTKKIETIQKKHKNEIYNYIKKDNKYYIDPIVITNITTRENVYDIVDYHYLNIDTINKYLSLSQKQDDKYITYLKDIVIGNDSEEYITITKDKNKLEINYTPLLKLFDNEVSNFTLEYIIEEVE